MQNPQMSVILIVDQQRGRGERCLQSILAQHNIDQLEVLLFDNQLGKEPPLSGSDHPAVQSAPLPPVKSFGEALVCGIEVAQAPVVAVIEEHSYAFPGWAEALIEAHQGPYAVVSGEVHNGNPGQPASDLIFLDYLPAMSPRKRGETQQMIGHNSSFKRELMLKFPRNELIEMFQSELLANWRLQEAGHKFFAEPAAKFAHCGESYYRSHWVGLFLSNRSFGHARARLYQWSPLRRLLVVLFAPVAPWVRLVRQVVAQRRNRPDLPALTFTQMCHMWMFHFMAVMGQATGLIFGDQDAGERFLWFEMNEYRYVEGIEVRPLFTSLFKRLPV